MNETTKNAPCLELEQDLVHYNELNAAERQRLEAHLSDCAACRRSLGELADLLPQTIAADEPPPAFWNSYSRELAQKLAQLAEREQWWRKLFAAFQPWPVPALATSALVALALTFTLAQSIWREHETAPPLDNAILEVLPIAENLDFYRNLDVLDNLDILQQMSEPGAA
jgi:anti-sigma-K factor RskA